MDRTRDLLGSVPNRSVAEAASWFDDSDHVSAGYQHRFTGYRSHRFMAAWCRTAFAGAINNRPRSFFLAASVAVFFAMLVGGRQLPLFGRYASVNTFEPPTVIRVM